MCSWPTELRTMSGATTVGLLGRLQPLPKVCRLNSAAAEARVLDLHASTHHAVRPGCTGQDFGPGSGCPELLPQAPGADGHRATG